MKTILQSIIAAAAVYVLVTVGISALSARGSSASPLDEQMAAQHMTQFLNNLDAVATH